VHAVNRAAPLLRTLATVAVLAAALALAACGLKGPLDLPPGPTPPPQAQVDAAPTAAPPEAEVPPPPPRKRIFLDWLLD
jgi:predicted small lipoprotein YifL